MVKYRPELTVHEREFQQAAIAYGYTPECVLQENGQVVICSMANIILFAQAQNIQILNTHGYTSLRTTAWAIIRNPPAEANSYKRTYHVAVLAKESAFVANRETQFVNTLYDAFNSIKQFQLHGRYYDRLTLIGDDELSNVCDI